jgi:hypothetical protein
MHFLKSVLTALITVFALLASLLAGAVAVIASIVLFFFRRSRLARSKDRAASPAHPAEARRTKMRDVDAIDVTATEVPSDPTAR